jgi:hypothetical protein
VAIDNHVEPESGETWTIVATYRLETVFTACDCSTRTAQATVQVDWNGSAWAAVCTAGCSLGGPIVGAAVCDSVVCGGAHSFQYELLVDLVANAVFLCGATPHSGQLETVAYTASDIDDGDELSTDGCSEIATRTPEAGPFTATDTGSFECPFNCDATGPTVTILYD